ncbi:unnamed protein product [Adineta ricciae]|uniref:Transposase n=1 Tax=Adineta ricciae TaxID=249248 RepID=A0A815RHP8_ADIRI|nr:unnamed protein product [Adineta ricciae]CAF1674881.1 unnamed protein product [Adineta ricciae]
MGKKHVSPYTRAQAVALYHSGMKVSKIAEQLPISRKCIMNAIERYEKHGEFSDLKRSGRPKKLSARDERHLKRLVKGENRLSAAKITSDLNSSLPKPVTRRTVCNYLTKLGFEYKVKLKKQWLSKKHRERRIAWCRQYVHWTIDDWRKVIFSDESTFYVLKRKNQSNTGDGGKIGIWGGISGHGITLLKIFNENMNGTLYCDVLKHELKQSMSMLPNKSEIIFQQDLAPWHTSNIVQNTIKRMKLNVLNWAPKSPDLNPIEMLWSILDKKLASKPIYSKLTLQDRLQQEWKNIDKDLCIKLIESMPERIQSCLKAKGGHFL